jgi:hypothetical protein
MTRKTNKSKQQKQNNNEKKYFVPLFSLLKLKKQQKSILEMEEINKA